MGDVLKDKGIMTTVYKRPKAVTILNALMSGHRVAKDDYVYVMSDDFDVCTVGTMLDTKDGSEREVLLRCFFDVAGFVGWCESFTDAEIVNQVANMVLNEVRAR